MYSKPRLAFKYLHYLLTASNGKGHGVHSPFVFNFIRFVLNDENQYYAYDSIESLRKKLLSDEQLIQVLDLGAGSSNTSSNERKLKDIARWTLKPAKYAQLLFRLINYYQPKNTLELGTSLGITTAYLAAANKSRGVYTLEGAPAIAAIAKQHFNQLYLTNIEQITGNFNDTLQPLLKRLQTVEFVFVDGNHRKEPTLQYFTWLLPHLTDNTIIVFDDIHWSAEMEAAWKEIIQHPSVTCSIDLFFVGIVLFRKEFKEKQDFTIRF